MSGRIAENATVRVRQTRTSAEFELATGDEEQRVEGYSKIGNQTTRKFQNAEIMGELLAYLDSLGFAEMAVAGAAPTNPGPDVLFLLEVTEDGRTRYVLDHSGATPDERTRVRTMVQAVLEVWNNTFGLQTVETRPGEEIFKQPGTRSR